LSWGTRHRDGYSRVFKHAACDTALDDAGQCPRCHVTPGPDDITMEPRPGRKLKRHDPVAIALQAPRRLLEPLETN
jgi:hypothetical protein